MEKKVFIGANNKEVMLYEWKAEKPRAVVQLVHGMAEHMGRYDAFSGYLNSNGITAVGLDLRGHGLTDPNTLGYGEGDMWENSVSDHLILSAHIKEEYELPLIIMGHSYGSFLTQRLIQCDKYADGYILSGSCYMKSGEVPLGKTISSLTAAFRGEKAPARIIYNISFKSYDKQFGGQAEWLSRDSDVIKDYNADSMCGYCCSANFYKAFFKGLINLYKKENLSSIDKNKPIFIMSGAEDPVGKKSVGVNKLYDMYVSIGVKNVQKRLYEQGRHEMLNETNKAEVFDDILKFIDTVGNPKEINGNK